MQAEQNEGKFEPDLAQLAGAAQSRAREGCVCARACLRACVRVCVCLCVGRGGYECVECVCVCVRACVRVRVCSCVCACSGVCVRAAYVSRYL